jgi:signal transduction histidine kinase
MKDEFISTVSHELRTPLTSIKGAAEILLNYRDEDSATQVEFLRIINNESDRLTRLINDVLDLSRIESGEMRWEISQVDVTRVVETAVLSTQALTVQKNVKVEVVSEKDLPSAVADPDKLVQVITNLLSNAVKFTPNGGFIRVQSRMRSGPRRRSSQAMVEISVSDNGIGIPTAEFDKIFGRFQQVGTSLSDRPQGTGLGLAISKEIVTHMGGHIWVESEVDKGSTFFFTVPTEDISTPVAKAPDKPKTKASQNGNHDVEDEQPSSSPTAVS